MVLEFLHRVKGNTADTHVFSRERIEKLGGIPFTVKKTQGLTGLGQPAIE